MHVSEDDMASFLIYSTRYAIGRMTYAVSEMCDYVKKYLPLLRDLKVYTAKIIMRDLDTEWKRHKKLGMLCDDACWKDLYKFLKQVVENGEDLETKS